MYITLIIKKTTEVMLWDNFSFWIIIQMFPGSTEFFPHHQHVDEKGNLQEKKFEMHIDPDQLNVFKWSNCSSPQMYKAFRSLWHLFKFASIWDFELITNRFYFPNWMEEFCSRTCSRLRVPFENFPWTNKQKDWRF